MLIQKKCDTFYFLFARRGLEFLTLDWVDKGWP